MLYKILSQDENTRKKLSNYIVNYCFNGVQKLGLPKELVGFMLKVFHFNIPFYCLVLILFSPIRVSLVCVSLLIFAVINFIYFKGCILSKIEYKLCKNDINIIDPFILLCRDKINNEKRYKYTLYLAASYFITAALILYIRYRNNL